MPFETKKNTKRKKLKERKYEIGRRADGTPIRKSFYGKNGREIEAKYRAFLLEEREEKRMADFITFEDLANSWLENYKRPSVSPKTYLDSYVCSVKSLTERIGDKSVVSITKDMIQDIFKNVKNTSESKANKMLMTAFQIFDHAVDKEIIEKSPMNGVVLGKTKASDEKKAFTDEEYKNAIAFAKGHKEGKAPLLALMAGLRISEICALKWTDIDFESNTLYITKSVTKDESGKWIVGSPKSEASVRAIPLKPDFCKYFDNLERTSQYVVPWSYNNQYHNKNSLHYRYKNYFLPDLISNNKKMQKLTMHELRHTYGTILYRIGTPLDVISTIMGHESMSFTKKTYVHDDVEDARRRIDFDKLP